MENIKDMAFYRDQIINLLYRVKSEKSLDRILRYIMRRYQEEAK